MGFCRRHARLMFKLLILVYIYDDFIERQKEKASYNFTFINDFLLLNNPNISESLHLIYSSGFEIKDTTKTRGPFIFIFFSILTPIDVYKDNFFDDIIFSLDCLLFLRNNSFSVPSCSVCIFFQLILLCMFMQHGIC